MFLVCSLPSSSSVLAVLEKEEEVSLACPLSLGCRTAVRTAVRRTECLQCLHETVE